MNLARAILALYPSVTAQDFELVQDVEGIVTLERWDVAGIPAPNLTEVASWLENEQNRAASEQIVSRSLQPGTLVAYLGLSNDPTLHSNTRLVLDFARDLSEGSSYPVIVPETGVYEVSISLYAYSGSTATVQAALELQRGGASSRVIVGEQFFYNRLPYEQRGVFHFERGDEFRASVVWGEVSYPKKIVGDWSRLKVSTLVYPLSRLLVRRV